MTDRRIAAVILAAGPSSRMGSLKQLLPYKGRPLLLHMAETVLASACRPVFVVLGSQADLLRQQLVNLPIELIENAGWQTGLGSSISTAARALESISPPIDAAILLLADQPLITPRILDQLIQTHFAGSPIVACSYADAFGPPVLFARQFFPDLLSLAGPQGAKPLIQKNLHQTTLMPFPQAQVDIDTPADYEGLR